MPLEQMVPANFKIALGPDGGLENVNKSSAFWRFKGIRHKIQSLKMPPIGQSQELEALLWTGER